MSEKNERLVDRIQNKDYANLKNDLEKVVVNKIMKKINHEKQEIIDKGE